MNPETWDGLTLEQLKEVLDQSPYNRWLAAEPLVLEAGYCEMQIPVRPDLLQYHGYVHGSLVGAAADNACAWAAASVAGTVVTAEYTLHLIAPALGDRLIGRGRVVSASSRRIVCRADVFAEKSGRETHAAAALANIAPLSPRRGILPTKS